MYMYECLYTYIGDQFSRYLCCGAAYDSEGCTSDNEDHSNTRSSSNSRSDHNSNSISGGSRNSDYVKENDND